MRWDGDETYLLRKFGTLISDLQILRSAGLVVILFAESAVLVKKGLVFLSADAQSGCSEESLLDTLSFVSQFFWYCSGVTFIKRYSLFFSFNLFCNVQAGWGGRDFL